MSQLSLETHIYMILNNYLDKTPYKKGTTQSTSNAPLVCSFAPKI